MSNEKETKKDSKEKGLSRRDFLKNTGLALGGIALGGGIVSGLNPNKSSEKEHAGHSASATSTEYNHALMYFTSEQLKTVEAMTETIFPKTDSGPGAKDLMVAYFIDHQLAGNWGNNTKEYMSGPFYPNEAPPELGYQTHLKRQEIFDIGINAINTYSNEKYKKKFYDLEEEEMIAVLTDFEEGKVEIKASFSSSFFFSLVRSATLEGVYSDPMYGGNKDMGGWKMKNFPGHQMSYANIIEQDKFAKIKPQSLNSQHKH